MSKNIHKQHTTNKYRFVLNLLTRHVNIFFLELCKLTREQRIM